MARNVQNIKRDIVFTETLRGFPLTFHSTWGLFSPERIDEGTRMLIESLDMPRAPRAALDLGCGYGPIGLTLAKLAPKGTVHMVDKDFVAVELAGKNAEANHCANCEIYLSNGLSRVSPRLQFDLVASNLPAKASSELYEILFTDVLNQLAPGGKFYVVTIAGLKEYIKRRFQDIFGNYQKIKQGKTYIVACAEKRAPSGALLTKNVGS